MDHPEDDITPPEIYFNRRRLLRGGLLVGTAAAAAGLYRLVDRVGNEVTKTKELGSVTAADDAPNSGFRVQGEETTSLADITNYNNFYEFSTDKEAVASKAAGFDTQNWKIDVGGLVHAPRTLDLDDLRKVADQRQLEMPVGDNYSCRSSPG